MQRAKVNGIEIAYEEMSTQGEPLVLIMGLGAQMVFWPDGLCELFAKSGFRVIRFDNRDIGLSTWLDDEPVPDFRRVMLRSIVPVPLQAPYLLTDMAQDTIGLLDHLGIERAHFVGASMGGMIAQTLAIHHPERAASLTTIMSSLSASPRFAGRPSVIRALFQPLPKSRDQAIEHSAKTSSLLAGTSLAFDWDAARQRAGVCFDRGSHPHGFLRQLAAINASGSRRAELRKLRLPTLVMHGTHDPLIRSAAGRATAKAIPGAKLHMLDGMGHTFPRQRWSEIVSEVRALADRAKSV